MRLDELLRGSASMGMAIDCEEAKGILWEEFRNAEADYQGGKPVAVPEDVANSTIMLGVKSRKLFVNNFLQLLDQPGVPAALKVAWNERIKTLF